MRDTISNVVFKCICKKYANNRFYINLTIVIILKYNKVLQVICIIFSVIQQICVKYKINYFFISIKTTKTIMTSNIRMFYICTNIFKYLSKMYSVKFLFCNKKEKKEKQTVFNLYK